VVQRKKTVASVNGSYREGVMGSGEVTVEDSAGVRVIPYEEVLGEMLTGVFADTGQIPWCTCSLGKKPGFAYNPDLDMWVESNCRKPTRMVWMKHANRQP
jgi:hypothetical protein